LPDRMYGKECWQEIMSNNVAEALWPDMMKSCLYGKSRKCKQDPATHEVSCPREQLQHVFGASNVCVGGSRDYSKRNFLLMSKYMSMMDKKKDWSKLFEDFVWESYLKPHDLPRDATFKDLDKGTFLAPNWWVHATVFKADGTPTSAGWQAVLDGKHADFSVVTAAAVSSEAFNTWTVMSALYGKNIQCNPQTAGTVGTAKPFPPGYRKSFTGNKEELRLKDSVENSLKIKSIKESLVETNKTESARGYNKEIGQNVFEIDGKIVGDGGGSDNQAFLALIRQIEMLEAEGTKKGMLPNIYPTVLMTPLSAMGGFWQAAQYFLPEVPGDQAAPIDGSMYKPYCPTIYNMVKNPTYVLDVPDTYFGKSNSRCVEHRFNNFVPPPGCMNLYSLIFSSGVLYFQDVSVLENKPYAINGGWRFPSVAFATQVSTIVSRRWLISVAPLYALNPESTAVAFPIYMNAFENRNSMMMMPIWEAFLMQNYMSHLADMMVCCFRRFNPLNDKKALMKSCALCLHDENLCPCHEILEDAITNQTDHAGSHMFPEE